MGVISRILGRGEEPTFRCPECHKTIRREEAAEYFYTCPSCGAYFRVRAKNRIRMIADPGSFEPWFEDIPETNPLDFPGYEEKLDQVREKTGLSEAVTIGRAAIDGRSCVLGVCDARFLMSSMGTVVGEKIARSVEEATRLSLPVILFCCSGGARMQEGILSLMQMAKTAAALKKHSEAGLLYISVLTDPTTGGVTASFAMLGDIILAEPGALIGFAGPRVIEQTIGQKLPEGFQKAEFLLEKGLIDGIIRREAMKQQLSTLLRLHMARGSFEDFAGFTEALGEPVRDCVSEILKERMITTPPMEPWERVKAARSMQRPSFLTYVNHIFTDFVELHGDRTLGDDKAVVGGIASLLGQSVTVIGIQKGNDPGECAERNFGMAGPEGYHKALRLMKQAEKFRRPVICMINTAGAYPGMEAEEHSQGEAIARNLFEMSALKVPVLSILIGEGGSGGALALAVANEVWMLENSTYSVLSPEGFASILWKDGKRAKEAAGVMGITAPELKRLGVIEEIIPEYGGADGDSAQAIALTMKEKMVRFLTKYRGWSGEKIAEERYCRFRGF